MYLKFLIIATLVAMITLASCEKDNSTPAEVAIEGKWVGKYSILSEPYNNYYSFHIKADGELERLDSTGTVTGYGSWEFSNNNTVIYGTYSLITPTANTFSFIANFDKDAGELDGTWGQGAQEYGGGYWYMEKQD